jgi:hypothetical protein
MRFCFHVLGGWRRGLTALLTCALPVAAAACKPEDEGTSSEVWGVDVASSPRAGEDASILIDGNLVTVRLTVHATTCGPEAHDRISARGDGYGHNCRPLVPGDSRADFDRSHPHLRVQELTATARVEVVAEHGSRRVGALYEGEVGPLEMGGQIRLDPLSWRFDQVPSGRSLGDGTESFSIFAMVKDCRLSNGSACANNSRRLRIGGPDEIGTSEQGLRAATLTVPDQAGGLDRLEQRSGGGAERPSQSNPEPPVGGLPIRRTVGGLFRVGNGLGRVSLWGAEFAQPQPPESVDESGSTIVQSALDTRAVRASAVHAPSRDGMRRYDSGPLGGQVWCQTYRYTALKKGTFYACGWVDRWTVGTIMVNDHAVADRGLTEADAAALLVAMRAATESVG